MDIKRKVREVLLGKEIDYPELTLYESFLKYNADIYLIPPDCGLSYGSFGISVIPYCFKVKKHSGLRLTIDIEGKINTTKYLPHQIYLHDLVLEKWKSENLGKHIAFKIECIRAKDESVEF